MPTEDRRVGKLLPSPVTPETTVCFTIQIPNAVQYRAAFLGQISVLGQALTWDHPRFETQCADCEEAAQLWRNALYSATFSDDCEMSMTCLDVANCIASDPFVASALAALMLSNTAIQDAIIQANGGVPVLGGAYVPGVPLTDAQMNAQLNVPDACDPDVFWAQSDQYVTYLIDLGQDVLERLQLYSEALASGASSVPGGQFIAKLKNGSTAGKVTEFLNWAVGTFKNAYESADTTDNRNALKCAIFCAMRDDCLITIQGTLDVLNTRLGGVLSPGDLEDLPALAEAMTTIVFNPSLAMDLWVLFLMATAKTAGLFGTQGIDETLQLVLAVASNDPSNDWEMLCDDCDETWCWTQDLKSNVDNIELVFGDYANEWIETLGIRGARAGFLDEVLPNFILPSLATATRIEFTYSAGDTTNALAFIAPGGVFDYTPQNVTTGESGAGWDLAASAISSFQFGMDRAGSDRTIIGYLTGVTIEGTGPNPFVSSNC